MNENILVPRASRPRASSLGPGTHGPRSSARKLAVVSKRSLGRFIAPVTIFTVKYYGETKYLC
jgi:hypothetical protein